jgi:hypothetical protein
MQGVNAMSRYYVMPEYSVKQTGPYAEWPIEAPVSRNFYFEILAPSVGVDGRKHDFDARVKLRANTTVHGGQRDCYLSFIIADPSNGKDTNGERWQRIRPCTQQLQTLGFVLDASRPRYGTWARYLLEVEKAHAALKILGWELTEEEQAIMDAVDDYARQAPARYATAA